MDNLLRQGGLTLAFKINLETLPPEDSFYEYKAGNTPWERLRHLAGKAASAFWNSGGGVLVVGANSDGSLDQGIDSHRGRTPLRDWIDQVVGEVHPQGPYSIEIYDRGTLQKDNVNSEKVVAVVIFEESHRAPHMAPDKHYYIRAGAHSEPAPGYVVEGLWARRHQRHPNLVHMLRLSKDKIEALQLVVINTSPEPALNVRLVLNPVPQLWQQAVQELNPFPLIYPIVDKGNPIELDISTWTNSDERIGPDSRIFLEYQDVLGKVYSYEETLLTSSYPPWRVDKDSRTKTVDALTRIEKAVTSGLDRVARIVERGWAQGGPPPENPGSYGFRVSAGTIGEEKDSTKDGT